MSKGSGCVYEWVPTTLDDKIKGSVHKNIMFKVLNSYENDWSKYHVKESEVINLA